MNILYRDDDLIAVHKPPGLLVHRSEIDRHETQFALQQVRDLIGQRVYPVHRLDKPTSGVLLFALNRTMARQMNEAFSRGAVKKEYLAVVRGYASEQDVVDYPLSEQLDKMTDRRVDFNKSAQEAVTRYQRLATVELPYAVGRYASSRYSLLKLFPLTGRKHQIRRHLKHVFHPIVGDTTHGDGKHNAFFKSHFNCQRLLLAATRLQFLHPVAGMAVEIKAPLEGAFEQLLNNLGWTDLSAQCFDIE